MRGKEGRRQLVVLLVGHLGGNRDRTLAQLVEQSTRTIRAEFAVVLPLFDQALPHQLAHSKTDQPIR